MKWRAAAVVACLILALLTGAARAAPVETGAGSKNFTSPRYVPNYFSNESSAVQGRAATAPSTPGPSYAAPTPAGRVVVDARHGGHRGAHVKARGRGARGKALASRRDYHTASVQRGGRAAARPAHGGARVGGKSAAAHGHTAAKGGARLARAGR